MKRFPSIRSNQDFQRVYQYKKSFANKYLIMYLCKNQRMYNRIGISASKKIGNSVCRHRITRRLREIFRLNDKKLYSGYDMIIVIRKEASEQKYKDLENAYLHLCRLHKLMVME